MAPTLVILAAGIGRRFGGDKQVAGLGPGGRPLLAYALHDAARAGFGRAVLVIREELEAPLRTVLRDAPVPIAHVVQETRPSGPWGTGHAVLAVAGLVKEPFMVVNADDFYGRDAYRAIAHALTSLPRAFPPEFVLAAFPLGVTLSAHGPVNRAICRTDADGWLIGIEEVTGLRPGSGTVPLETPVSMNGWGFTPALFPLLRGQFGAFAEDRVRAAGAEFMLPRAVHEMVAAGEARVRVVPVPGPWLGVTYPEDQAPVAAALARLTAAGEYPA